MDSSMDTSASPSEPIPSLPRPSASEELSSFVFNWLEQKRHGEEEEEEEEMEEEEPDNGDTIHPEINAEESHTAQNRRPDGSRLVFSGFDYRPSYVPRKHNVTTSFEKGEKSKEKEILEAHRAFQLACASRQTILSQINYQQARLREIDVMKAVAHGQYQQAVASLNSADQRIEEARQTLKSLGETVHRPFGPQVEEPQAGPSDPQSSSAAGNDVPLGALQT